MGPGKSPCQASDGIGNGNAWDLGLPAHYSTDGASVVSKQIAKAGARLA